MQISKSAGYAIHGLGYLVTRGTTDPVQISEISNNQDVSKTYLANIFQQLSTARIVVGHRGVTGGYLLAHEPKDITLVNIIEAVDGPVIRRHCCLGMFGCAIKSRCYVLNVFNEANERFVEVLQNVTLQDVVDRMTELDAPFLSIKSIA